MAGPWVGIAAPGENIVSVSNRDGGGLANGLPDDHQQLIALSGTSYAAGYVSGVAALVRSKYPALTAAAGGAPHHRYRAQRCPGAVQRRRRRHRRPGGGADVGAACQPGERRGAGQAGRRSRRHRRRRTTDRGSSRSPGPPRWLCLWRPSPWPPRSPRADERIPPREPIDRAGRERAASRWRCWPWCPRRWPTPGNPPATTGCSASPSLS